MCDIYRVMIKTTGSLQQTSSFWSKEVIYCGTDREEARIAYYKSEPLDFGVSYGNGARVTIVEVIKDAGTANFDDDEIVDTGDDDEDDDEDDDDEDDDEDDDDEDDDEDDDDECECDRCKKVTNCQEVSLHGYSEWLCEGCHKAALHNDEIV